MYSLEHCTVAKGVFQGRASNQKWRSMLPCSLGPRLRTCRSAHSGLRMPAVDPHDSPPMGHYSAVRVTSRQGPRRLHISACTSLLPTSPSSTSFCLLFFRLCFCVLRRASACTLSCSDPPLIFAGPAEALQFHINLPSTNEAATNRPILIRRH